MAFALGDGRVRLLPADINAAETPAAEPLHGGAVQADPQAHVAAARPARVAHSALNRERGLEGARRLLERGEHVIAAS